MGNRRRNNASDGVNFWVKSLRFKVPMLKGTPDEFDTIEFRRESQPNGEHVETVVLLSKKKATDFVEIGVDAEDYYRIKEKSVIGANC